MATRKFGPLDELVGAKIRQFRTDCGMSQGLLAEKIGVSLQQVQEYETGASRVGASRLSRIATVLGTSFSELFENCDDRSAGLNSPVRLLAEPGALRIIKACVRASNPRATFDRKAGGVHRRSIAGRLGRRRTAGS